VVTAKETLDKRVEPLSEEEAAEWLAKMDWESTDTETLTDDELAQVRAAGRDSAEGRSVSGEEVFPQAQPVSYALEFARSAEAYLARLERRTEEGMARTLRARMRFPVRPWHEATGQRPWIPGRACRCVADQPTDSPTVATSRG
jgi:hypothetical protein